MKNIVKIVLSATILVAMSGCASKPTHLDLVIKSSNNINLDSDNVSSPLMLNFYELDSAEQFSKLDYWTLLDSGKDRLNSDLISQNKHIILPSEKQHYKIIFNDKAKFLGIIGNFRNLDSNSTWRYVINLEDKTHNSVELEINKYRIKEAE
ncbi:type VI secretion system lipoprotein TssJ [Sulfurimonas sp.]|uniref:type VI secretion system lipoprotein TssJ n=1 Tax=Sulfurimonas sp. TaxID=2022749 RepID=UPI002B4A5BBE|nr:type VI secretion system lipoprotein TssJ [Sulfurimonas sp.]